MNEIQIFQNQEFGAIRTMKNEQGEAMFCGKDVAEALGYNNPLKAIRNHVDSEDKGVNELGTPGGKQKIIFINVPEPSTLKYLQIIFGYSNTLLKICAAKSS